MAQELGPSFIGFVDALDECDENDARRVVEFFRNTASSAVSSGASLRICLSSRHYPNISLRKCLNIQMEQQNEADIQTYVHTQITSVITEREGLELEAAIIHKASGVFLWVVLVVEMLLNQLFSFAQSLIRLKIQVLPHTVMRLLYRRLDCAH